MRIFHSKHQKLILQCYPPGKGADKKPNPSELSYLLYYASTRRVKLEKVADFLFKKTCTDTSRNRSGNLQVTLAILSSLIEKCSENLNVFALDVCHILQLIVNLKDLALFKSFIETYGIFCRKLDGGLFTGDKQFVDLFSKLSKSVIEMGFSTEFVKSPNKLEWNTISLMACRHISSCLGHNARFSKKFIGIVVPLYIETIHTNVSTNGLISELRSNINLEVDSLHLSRTVLTKFAANSKNIQQILDNDTLTASDLSEEAIDGIRSLFNTTLTNQIVDATRAIVDTNLSRGIDQKWGCTFLEMCITWIPVQLRFVALVTLISKLSQLSHDYKTENQGAELELHYAQYILGLVSSEVNMIGLSISDVIQELLTLQSDLYLENFAQLNDDDISKLSLIYSNCICNLSTHIYYFDQVPDSIQEILLKIHFILESPYDGAKMNSKRFYNLIITLLEDISIIFSLLDKKPSSITRNRASLELWDITLPLLSSDLNMVESSILASSQISQIQLKYLKVFKDFLNKEFIQNDDKSSSDDLVSTENLLSKRRKYLEPDFNQYISLSDNFLTHFLIYATKFFNENEDPSQEISSYLLLIFKDLASILGVNFIHCFIPFFYSWWVSDESQLTSKKIILRDSVALSVLYYCLKSLDIDYSHLLSDYAMNSDFSLALLKTIKSRKEKKLWINCDSDSVIEENINNVSEKLNLEDYHLSCSKEDLQIFITGNEFLSQCINPDKPLNLLINPKDLSELHDRGKNNILAFGSSELSSNSGDYTELTESSIKHSQYVGLGTAGDIISIHSEFVSQNHQSNGKGHSSSSTTTDEKSHYTPRASDLREILSDSKNSNLRTGININKSFPSSSYPASILSKQIYKKDVESILDELASDDDDKLVV